MVKAKLHLEPCHVAPLYITSCGSSLTWNGKTNDTIYFESMHLQSLMPRKYLQSSHTNIKSANKPHYISQHKLCSQAENCQSGEQSGASSQCQWWIPFCVYSCAVLAACQTVIWYLAYCGFKSCIYCVVHFESLACSHYRFTFLGLCT